MAEVTPEQNEIYMYSNLGTVVQEMGHKNPEEFKRLKQMTIREGLVWELEKKQFFLNESINAINKFHQEKPVKVEKISIDDMECRRRDSSPPYSCEALSYDVSIFLRNTGDSAVYFECQEIAPVLDGKQLEATNSININCQDWLGSKGGTKVVKLHGGLGYGRTDTKTISRMLELYNAGNAASIAFAFIPKFQIKSGDNDKKGFDAILGFMTGAVELDDKSMATYKAELDKIAGYLAVLKK